MNQHKHPKMRHVAVGGYVKVFRRGHPRASKGYVSEHILVVEDAMGKPLRKSAPVHHVDQNPSNNSNANLVACDSQGYHLLLHRRARAFEAVGDANARKCPHCRKHDRVANMVSYDGNTWSHRACQNAYQRELYGAKPQEGRKTQMSNAQRSEIVRRQSEGNVSYRTLAQEYGISSAGICVIIKRAKRILEEELTKEESK